MTAQTRLITVLITGVRRSFKTELEKWLKRDGEFNATSIQVRTEECEPGSNMVFCEMQSTLVTRFHTRLMGIATDGGLDFVDAIFPQNIFNRKAVILGPAVARQKRLIENLAPFTFAPAKRMDLAKQ